MLYVVNQKFVRDCHKYAVHAVLFQMPFYLHVNFTINYKLIFKVSFFKLSSLNYGDQKRKLAVWDAKCLCCCAVVRKICSKIHTHANTVLSIWKKLLSRKIQFNFQ